MNLTSTGMASLTQNAINAARSSNQFEAVSKRTIMQMLTDYFGVTQHQKIIEALYKLNHSTNSDEFQQHAIDFAHLGDNPEKIKANLKLVIDGAQGNSTMKLILAGISVAKREFSGQLDALESGLFNRATDKYGSTFFRLPPRDLDSVIDATFANSNDAVKIISDLKNSSDSDELQRHLIHLAQIAKPNQIRHKLHISIIPADDNQSSVVHITLSDVCIADMQFEGHLILNDRLFAATPPGSPNCFTLTEWSPALEHLADLAIDPNHKLTTLFLTTANGAKFSMKEFQTNPFQEIPIDIPESLKQVGRDLHRTLSFFPVTDRTPEVITQSTWKDILKAHIIPRLTLGLQHYNDAFFRYLTPSEQAKILLRLLKQNPIQSEANVTFEDTAPITDFLRDLNQLSDVDKIAVRNNLIVEVANRRESHSACFLIEDIRKAFINTLIDNVEPTYQALLIVAIDQNLKMPLTGLGEEIKFRTGTGTIYFQEVSKNYLFTLNEQKMGTEIQVECRSEFKIVNAHARITKEEILNSTSIAARQSVTIAYRIGLPISNESADPVQENGKQLHKRLPTITLIPESHYIKELTILNTRGEDPTIVQHLRQGPLPAAFQQIEMSDVEVAYPDIYQLEELHYVP